MSSAGAFVSRKVERLPRGSALLLFVALSWPAVARAEESTSERAERLYLEAKTLSSASRYTEACPLFEESQRLEPAIGTQYNLADCYEHVGRPAAALALFREVARVAKLTGKADRHRQASEHANDLEAVVPRLRVEVAPPAPRDLVVKVDDIDATASARDAGVPVDIGPHRVVVVAPGYVTIDRTVEVTAGKNALTVPALERDQRVIERKVAVLEKASPLRPAGFATALVGAGGVVAGGVFGAFAITKKGDAGCDGTDCRGAGDGETLRTAQTFGDLSTIFVIAGAALVAGGLTMVLLAPKRPAASVAAVSF